MAGKRRSLSNAAFCIAAAVLLCSCQAAGGAKKTAAVPVGATRTQAAEKGKTARPQGAVVCPRCSKQYYLE